MGLAQQKAVGAKGGHDEGFVTVIFGLGFVTVIYNANIYIRAHRYGGKSEYASVFVL